MIFSPPLSSLQPRQSENFAVSSPVIAYFSVGLPFTGWVDLLFIPLPFLPLPSFYIT